MQRGLRGAEDDSAGLLTALSPKNWPLKSQLIHVSRQHMEHRALAALMVRLVGLWELVVAVNAVPTAIGPLFNPEYVQKAGLWVLVGVALFSVALPLALGLMLIYFPSTVATQVLRVDGIEPKTASDTTLLERVAFSAMGLWFTANAVIDGVHVFSRWHLYRRIIEDQYPGASGPAIGPNEFAGFITAAVQLVLGLWLLLGSRGLANAFARLRE
jgi:hypothetical protein